MGEKQIVKIPRNLFDFDIKLVLNMVAHRNASCSSKDPNSLVEDKMKENFKRIMKCFFIKFSHKFQSFRLLY